jgi:hypothetical protein
MRYLATSRHNTTTLQAMDANVSGVPCIPADCKALSGPAAPAGQRPQRVCAICTYALGFIEAYDMSKAALAPTAQRVDDLKECFAEALWVN